MLAREIMFLMSSRLGYQSAFHIYNYQYATLHSIYADWIFRSLINDDQNVTNGSHINTYIYIYIYTPILRFG